MSISKKSARSSVIWSAIERFSTQGVQFIVSFIVARQLFPSDYGLIAMLTIFVALAQSFVDSGFSKALIQKQERTQTDFSTVFFFNIIIAVILYIILVLCGPLIARFYNQPLLSDIIIWVGLNIVISSFSIIQIAKLTIDLDFKRQATASLIGCVISGGVAIYLAYNDFGVWTLVIQGLLKNFITTFVLWIHTGWRPSFVFSIKSFNTYFKFGSKILLGGFIHILYMNVYSLVIGKIFQVRDLGLYGRASQIAQFPSTNITGLFERVVYPIECALQNDLDQLESKFYYFLKIIALLTFPIMIGLIVLCEPLVRIILTDKWIACVPLIRILCMAYTWDTFMRLNWVLLCVMGRTDYTLKSEIYKKISAFILLFCSIPLGLEGVAASLVVYSFVDLFIITRYTRKVIPGINLYREMAILIPILLQVIAVSVITYLIILFIDNDVIKLLVGTFVGLSLTASLYAVFYRKEIKTLIHLKK